MVFHWIDTALDAFVAIATAPRFTAAPAWLILPGMTVSSLKDNVIALLALVAGGSFGRALIAPNNLVQFANVVNRLGAIEHDPFIQECMLLLPVNSVLANVAIITDRTLVNATPAARVIIAPNRLVFA